VLNNAIRLVALYIALDCYQIFRRIHFSTDFSGRELHAEQIFGAIFYSEHVFRSAETSTTRQFRILLFGKSFY
jgi:hypothetical protein